MTSNDRADSNRADIHRADSNRAEHDTERLEAERHRIAALLESEVINPLALLLSQASLYEQTMGAHPQAFMAVSVLGGLIRQSLQKARDLQANLHPSLLEALGLEPALEALASQHIRTTGLRVSLAVGRLHQRLSPEIELALFRAAQFLIDHAVSQVHAAEITIQLQPHDNTVLFVYMDDGLWSDALVRGLSPLLHSLQVVGAKTYAGLYAGKKHDGVRVTATFAMETTIQLTARELEILTLLVEGLGNKEIAARLNVSTRTVNFHLDNLYSKLGVNNRTEAVVYAIRHGLADLPG